MSKARHSDAELASGAAVHWLLDLSWAGGVIRVSDADLEIDTEDGLTLRYYPGLDQLDVTEGIELLADASATAATVSITAILPVDVPALVAKGYDLASGLGELSRWVEGTDWEDRRVVMRGVMSDPEYGAAEEAVRFSLEAQVFQDETTIPSSSLAVLAENWADAMILGLAVDDWKLPYPIIVGRPGLVSTSLAPAGWCSATRGVWVQKDHGFNGVFNYYYDLSIVIAGHHVTATSVFANTDTFTAGYPLEVKNGVDFNGHPIAYLHWFDAKSAAAGDWRYELAYAAGYTNNDPTAGSTGTLGHQLVNASFRPGAGNVANVYIGWYDKDTSGGGMRAPDGSTMELAGDVLEWLLSLTSIPVDRGRCAVAKELLQGYRLGFTIDSGVKPWEWAREHLLPLLPVSIVSGPDGLYPVVWRYWATAADAVHKLDTAKDPGIERTSGVRIDRSKIINDFAMDYGYTARTGTYRGKVRLGAEGVDSGVPSLHCTLSQRQYLRPDGDPLVVEEQLQTVCVYDDTTARLVLEWRAMAYALARRRVSYRLPLRRWGRIERGQVVTITDAELHLSAEVAMVEWVRTDDSPNIEIGLLIVEDPTRTLLQGA